MPSIEEGIASLKSLSDAKELEDKLLRLKMLLEEGIITQDEADQRFIDFKRSKGMALGGEILSMANGGEALNFDRLFRALIQVESGGIPDRVSPAGAIGLTQIMPETAMKPGYGVDDIFTLARKMNVPFAEESLSEAKRLLFNTELNTKFGRDYLKAMIDYSGGDIKTALQGYNYGLDRVLNLKAKGEPITVEETINYPIKVMAAYNGINPNDPQQLEIFKQSPNVESAMFEMAEARGATQPKTDIQGVLESLNIFKSEDPITPSFQPLSPPRPTELTEQLGLPGDILRDAEVELQMAEDPNLVGFSKEPMARSFAMEEEEKDPILASSSLPLQRPSGIN